MPRTLEECDEAITALTAENAELRERLDAVERGLWPTGRTIRFVASSDPEYDFPEFEAEA